MYRGEKPFVRNVYYSWLRLLSFMLVLFSGINRDSVVLLKERTNMAQKGKLMS